MTRLDHTKFPLHGLWMRNFVSSTQNFPSLGGEFFHFVEFYLRPFLGKCFLVEVYPK